MHHKHVISVGESEVVIETGPKWGVVIAINGKDGAGASARVSRDAAFAIKRAIEGVALDADEAPDW